MSVGAAIGARGEDIVLVDNATAAINAVLGSWLFEPGDEILIHAHTYGAVLRTASHIAARTGADRGHRRAAVPRYDRRWASSPPSPPP